MEEIIKVIKKNQLFIGIDDKIVRDILKKSKSDFKFFTYLSNFLFIKLPSLNNFKWINVMLKVSGVKKEIILIIHLFFIFNLENNIIREIVCINIVGER